MIGQIGFRPIEACGDLGLRRGVGRDPRGKIGQILFDNAPALEQHLAVQVIVLGATVSEPPGGVRLPLQ